MPKRQHSKLLFGSLLAILAFSAACKKPVPQAPAPPPPTPAAPPARPTVDLQASTTIIQRGESVTLTWTSTNATSLSLSPGIGNVPAEGTQRVTPQDSTTYTISATGPGGSADANVRITVSAPAPAARTAEPTMQQLFEREVKDAYFDYDKADIRADARDNLSQTAQFLRSYPQVKIVIEGHCDERGSTEYNLALGDRRAAAAKQFLASLGISADRMETVSYGKERPFCTASDEACYTQNRRAHIVMGK
ncbi:MAG TPA: peptidoglycan-associated lipoprotein Pal [Candidatus Saccharimonadales bacterium]|jgi:peptidoglycan-associated lipoprotein|nr:peptidoglycan-associated lipoprotein Pal [Candidatus Saccharimonadales bacterium]